MKIRHLVIAIAIASVLPATTAMGQESGEQRSADAPTTTPPDQTAPAEIPERSIEERVVFLLSGYEYFPTRPDLDAVGAPKEIAALLRGMARDADRRPTLRLRAVDALGYYDDEETLSFLTDLVTTTPDSGLERRALRTAGLIRHHAITSLAKAQGADATSTLSGLLSTDDVQLQLTVIHALGKHGGDAGRAELKRLAARTKRPIIKRELRKWVD